MEGEMKKALITGGAGFIGSHIAEALVSKGCRVTILDNLASGHIENLEGVMDDITFIQGDIQDEKTLAQATKDCDVVFHQAAVVSVTKTVADPIASTTVNDLGTLKVLDAACLNNVRRVVLASSSAVYGDNPELPKVESMAANPLSPYAVQKLTNEFYAALYYRLYHLETVCLRYFNVYGPRQDPSSPYSGVISIFMQRAVNKSVPVIYGDGQQTRDFVFVKDVAQANLLAAVGETVPGQVFNVGTNDAITINALWQKIARLGKFERNPDYTDARSGDIVHSLAGIQKAREQMGFQPTVAFEDGLSETFNWYKDNS